MSLSTGDRTRKKELTANIAAKAALRRKKQFEHAQEQTSSQIMTLEREIYSIETANINKETLDAIRNAGQAMKHIHAGLTIDKVDQTMYVTLFSFMLYVPFRLASSRGSSSICYG